MKNLSNSKIKIEEDKKQLKTFDSDSDEFETNRQLNEFVKTPIRKPSPVTKKSESFIIDKLSFELGSMSILKPPEAHHSPKRRVTSNNFFKSKTISKDHIRPKSEMGSYRIDPVVKLSVPNNSFMCKQL